MKFILGSLISMTKLRIHFQFSFIIGGQCLVALPLSYLVKLRNDGISGLQTTPLMRHLQKKYNSSESSTLSGYSVGNTDIKIIFLIHFPYLLFGSTRSDGGMNTKQSSVAKKMLNISAEQNPKNTPSKTFIHLTKIKKLHEVHLPLPKWKYLQPLQNPNPRD